MYKPFLIGKKIYLREIEEADLNENYQQWFNDEEVCLYNSHHRFPNYRQDMEEYYKEVIKPQKALVLAIIDKKTNQHIGNISLQLFDPINKSAQFAIIIGNKKFWGKGVGTEAVKLIIGHGFKSLNLHRIFCGMTVDNIGMQRVVEKLGFKKEGISREALYKDGRYKNVINYDLLKSEYEK